MFAREGYSLIATATAAALALVLSALGLWLGGWGGALVLVGLLLLGFVVWFFRDPARVPPPDARDLLLAPADGTVVEIVAEEEPLYLKEPSQRVSIFLSPLNAHVNRSPADSVVEFGSRMDIAVPPHVSLDVEVGQKTVAGETVISRFGERLGAADRVPLGADDALGVAA